MKLIDLLVRELPKRGGWPQNVTHIGQDYDRDLMFYGIGRAMTGIFLDELAIDHRKCGRAGVKITRDQYESALAASQKGEWSGDGLPPVGCECEWQDKNTKQWQPVKVVYASEWVTVIREINKEKGDDLVEIAIENYGDDARLKFRPLRSESDKKRDAALDAIYGAIASAEREHNRSDEADKVYEAIAAGKIPGVKLED